MIRIRPANPRFSASMRWPTTSRAHHSPGAWCQPASSARAISSASMSAQLASRSTAPWSGPSSAVMRVSALDLADDRDGVDRLAHVLRRRDLHDLDEACAEVDVDARAVCREQERDVAVVLGALLQRLGRFVAIRDAVFDRRVQERLEA